MVVTERREYLPDRRTLLRWNLDWTVVEPLDQQGGKRTAGRTEIDVGVKAASGKVLARSHLRDDPVCSFKYGFPGEPALVPRRLPKSGMSRSGGSSIPARARKW